MKKDNFFKDFLRGGALGLGMVPGVSAGTMAMVVGIYDKLVGGMASLTKHFKESVKTLFPICLGAVISAVLFFIGVHFGYNYAPIAITSAFAGIVLGTLPLITKELKGQKFGVTDWILLIISFIIAAGIGVLSAISALKGWFNLSEAFIDPAWWVYLLVFISGFIAAVACLIPGISGSMILFVFGLYVPITEIFMGDNSIFKNHDRLLSGLLLILVLVIGILIGFVSVSKAMKSLLEKHKIKTFDCVIGFVIGSIVSMFINNNLVVTSESGNILVYQTTQLWEWIIAPMLLIGFTALFYFISRKALSKEEAKDAEN